MPRARLARNFARPPARQSNATLDPQAKLVGQIGEVAQRAEMDIGGLIPARRQSARDRHAPVEQEVEAHAPMAKIGNRDDEALANARHFAQDIQRFLRGLQRLAQNNRVETIIWIIR